MKTIQGNLLDMFDACKFDVIIHGCNCFCTMGAGIAQQIAERYPAAYNADQLTSNMKSHEKLGLFSIVSWDDFIGRRKFIINAYTQHQPSRDLSYHALYHAFKNIFYNLSLVVPYHPLKVGIPQIGCGIAGGDWDIVEWLINKANRDFNIDVTVVIYNQGV